MSLLLRWLDRDISVPGEVLTGLFGIDEQPCHFIFVLSDLIHL